MTLLISITNKATSVLYLVQIPSMDSLSIRICQWLPLRRATGDSLFLMMRMRICIWVASPFILMLQALLSSFFSFFGFGLIRTIVVTLLSDARVAFQLEIRKIHYERIMLHVHGIAFFSFFFLCKRLHYSSMILSCFYAGDENCASVWSFAFDSMAMSGVKTSIDDLNTAGNGIGDEWCY